MAGVQCSATHYGTSLCSMQASAKWQHSIYLPGCQAQDNACQGARHRDREELSDS
jgi:hypothetical protein